MNFVNRNAFVIITTIILMIIGQFAFPSTISYLTLSLWLIFCVICQFIADTFDIKRISNDD